MRLNRLFPFLLLVTTCTGCYHGMYRGGYRGNYYGTTPYGSGGYGGGYGGYGGGAVYPGYGQPIQTLPPNQPQYYPGTLPLGTPTYNGTGTGTIQPIPDGGSAPTFQGGGGPTVPDPYYTTPGSAQLNNPTNTLGSSQGNLQPAGHLMPINENQGVGLGNSVANPVQQSASLINAEVEQIPRALNSQFESSPMGGYAAPAQPEIQFEAPATASPFPDEPAAVESQDPFFVQKVNPYGYDREYQWLKGIVAQDERDGSWSVTFSDNPSADDVLQGSVSLAASPFLEQLQTGDVVQIEGQVDPVARDTAGRYLYLIKRLEKVTTSPPADPTP